MLKNSFLIIQNIRKSREIFNVVYAIINLILVEFEVLYFKVYCIIVGDPARSQRSLVFKIVNWRGFYI